MALVGSLARRALRWLKDVQDVAPASQEVFMSFRDERDVESRWRAWSDAEHGGMSSASVSWIPRPEGAEDGDEGAMVLAGTLSTDTVRPLTRLEPAPGATPTTPDPAPKGTTLAPAAWHSRRVAWTSSTDAAATTASGRGGGSPRWTRI